VALFCARIALQSIPPGPRQFPQFIPSGYLVAQIRRVTGNPGTSKSAASVHSQTKYRTIKSKQYKAALKAGGGSQRNRTWQLAAPDHQARVQSDVALSDGDRAAPAQPDWSGLAGTWLQHRQLLAATLARAMRCQHMSQSSQRSSEPRALGPAKYSFQLVCLYSGLARTLALPIHMRQELHAARRDVCKKATFC
jgi:hypothetical protein